MVILYTENFVFLYVSWTGFGLYGKFIFCTFKHKTSGQVWSYLSAIKQLKNCKQNKVE